MGISYDDLRSGVAGSAVGARARTVLEPLGGPNDKIFPPTYGPAEGELPKNMETKYAVETRVSLASDAGVKSVVLDSVASQANRFELALLEAVRRGDLVMPLTSVDFSPNPDLGLDRLSDLEAPHRIFDALLRDSYDGALLFRFGGPGRAITEATSRNAGALFHHAPATLVFGGWDSTGPKGGRGAKYERALTSEVVATDVSLGAKTSSRIDPAAIEKAAVVYMSDDDLGWTLDEAEAVRDETGKPRLVGKKKANLGVPSGINHGNIPPTIDTKSGGVTAKRIVATTVLSFIQLRRLCFPTGLDLDQLPDRSAAEVAARTALAALGLAAVVLAVEEGFDLRSRCVLVATEPFQFELVGRDGTVDSFTLSAVEATALVHEAAEASARAGLPWREAELLLRPSERLVDLIRRSRAHAVAVGDAGEE